MSMAIYLTNTILTCHLVRKNYRYFCQLNKPMNGNYARYYSKMKGLVLGTYTQSSKTGNEICEYTSSFKDVDGKCKGKLSMIVKSTGPFTKSIKQKLLWVPLITEPKLDFDCISVVDLGVKDPKDNPLEDLNQKAENVRCAISTGVSALRSAADFEDIYIDSCDSPQSAAEGAYLTLFSCDKFKDQSSCRTKSNVCLHEYAGVSKEIISEFEKGVLLAECQNFSRTLMDTPANHMTPTIFSSTVAEKLKEVDVKVVIRDKGWIQSMKMGSFLSVARGSDEEPKFQELHYDGAPSTEKCIALVGKGVTFDSGGISLKPSKSMDEMRADMGGAACVVATILAASKLKLKLNVKGFIPLTENMPSGTATKPGDIVTAMCGKTIKVDNTDAEGRLILCDALTYAHQFKPFAILDIATLTGAIGVALGNAVTGVYSTDEELWQTLHKAGTITGDRVWRMPLFKYYKQAVTDCHLADLTNLGTISPLGGSCTAAAFLHDFIEQDTKWLHLDIASVMTCGDKTPYSNKGMSGRPTRTVVQFLTELQSTFQK